MLGCEPSFENVLGKDLMTEIYKIYISHDEIYKIKYFSTAQTSTFQRNAGNVFLLLSICNKYLKMNFSKRNHVVISIPVINF